MKKYEFLDGLRSGLRGLSAEDIDRSVEFYSEMIDDRIEDGLDEEAAVAEIGTVEKAVSEIVSEIPLGKLIKERVKPKRTLKVWEILLLILGCPVWLPILIAVFCIILAVYIVIWAVIISLYAVDVSFAVCGLGGTFGALVCFMTNNYSAGIFLFGAGLVCAGISILLFFAFNLITKGILKLTKKMFVGIKSCFIRKENT